MLPDHVGSPGPLRLTVGAGVEGSAPAADVRFGLNESFAIYLEGVWHVDAPLLGAGLRLAAGRKGDTLYAYAWTEGHLRPALTTEVTQALAGGDMALGLGVSWLKLPLVASLEGGLVLGIPVAEVELPDEDLRSAVDQQGGLFGVQRARLGLQLGDHLQLAARASLGLPISALRLDRPEDDLISPWDLRLGAQALARF